MVEALEDENSSEIARVSVEARPTIAADRRYTSSEEYGTNTGLFNLWIGGLVEAFVDRL